VVMAFFFSGLLKRITITSGWACGRSTSTWSSLIGRSSGEYGAGGFEAVSPFHHLAFQGRGFRQQVFRGKPAKGRSPGTMAIVHNRQGAFREVGAGKHEAEKPLIGRRARQRIRRPSLALGREQPFGRSFKVCNRRGE